ncbi:hypothetical protein [Rhabdochlamydiaceae symbiont of Dictyostelium giganteum]|uniref:hypothetical protein n=1 Tax=Rhabdochlamydiaceae symbiont of Dictyostelium giganteum TaxID=3342349 RepID=UPI00384FB2ED
MSQETIGSKTKSLKDIEEIISRAIKKVGAKRENDICRYIPMNSGGYMHHFTLKKMKTKQPGELGAMIEKFIINADRPGMVTPKQRAPRGSRKRKDHLTFTKTQIERMLAIAKLAGDKEMVSVLSPKRSMAVCKRELISSIRHNRLEPELWNAYVEAINSHQLANEFFNQTSK